MKINKLFSDNGYIAMALTIVTISLFSVIAITQIGVLDSHNLAVGFQKIQQQHLIRSETSRGVIVAKVEMQNLIGAGMVDAGFSSIELGYNPVPIDAGFGKFTFKMRSKVYQEPSSEVSPFANNTVLNISSLGKAYTGINNLTHNGVGLFSKKILKNQTFAGFHYFTNNEASINEDLDDPDQVKFWGRDEIRGIVRSNTDIYIQNGGGTEINGGWPLFHDEVYTSGEIKPYAGSGQVPIDQVFRKGVTENVPPIEFPDNADLARTGEIVEIDPGDAILAYVDGDSYSLWYADRIIGVPDTVVVYDLNTDLDDPDTIEREDSLGVQYLTQIDTVWYQRGNGRVRNNSIFFTGELWLQGTFSGRQTWASQDTMYLAGDILLSGTEKGSPPDGFNPDTGLYDLPINYNDYVGLVSEKSILIQYGYREPEDSIRIKNNCGRYEDLDGDTGDGGIYIYAAMAALGEGEVSMQDGVFSFQYHHPHVGTIARLDGQIVELANHEVYGIAPYDNGWGPLHFFWRNNTSLDPNFPNWEWDPEWCYPYYGPLWPETRAETFMERGTIHLYGSVAQRRRGFVHRSGNDNINTGGEWDIANYRYGDHPRFLGLPPAPGASGTGVGYQKNYNYDNRFRNSPPPNFPEVHIKGGARELDTDSWYLYRVADAPIDLIF